MKDLHLPINFVLIEDGIARRFVSFPVLQEYLRLRSLHD